MASKYNHKKVEAKWQEKWYGQNLFTPDLAKAEDKFYNLFMFPYPSAEGLHAGHAFSSTGSDVYGRFQRMNGKNVFQPMGYDSFGIHPENYAIKTGEHPQKMLGRTIAHYEKQFKMLGHGYDWTKTVTTSDVEYYRWTQWLFVQMFKAGLAYRKEVEVNFCPSCKTVLADEQVVTPKQAGKEPKNAKGGIVADTGNLAVCERCGTIVEERKLEQWLFRITNYADRLLAGLVKIDWPERIKIAQRNWIGKKEGMEISFEVVGSKEKLKVFTTRPDTLNAVTFLAVPWPQKTSQDMQDMKEKVGEFTGKYAINPLDGERVPIWKANYVLETYAHGAIMGVPAHDGRDAEFAKKYDIDIVVKKPDGTLWQKIEAKQIGKRVTTYHLRDWLVSRQRYWGAPIPMVDCPKDGWVAVPEEDLPVLLPDIKDFEPEGNGRGPLANHPEFYETKCPKCGGKARRETDVMDTFVDSSWYFLRYPSVNANSKTQHPNSKQIQNSKKTNSNKLGFGVWDLEFPWDRKITRDWLPVDQYFGGAEHSVLHLMYARFVTMVLKDLGFLNFSEPFPHFYAHGLMIKDGAKMSKSRGNVVNPDEYVEKFGADTLRLYVMFMGPMDSSPDFRDTGIEGMERFVNRLWRTFNSIKIQTTDAHEIQVKLNQTIKKVTEDIENFRYNTAISSIMELVNAIRDEGMVSKGALKALCLLIAPFAPHLAEEVWVEVLGQKYSVHKAAWPRYDKKYLRVESIAIAVQVNGKLRGQVTVEAGKIDDKAYVIDLAKAEEKVAKWLEGKKIRNEVYVEGKIVNLVT